MHLRKKYNSMQTLMTLLMTQKNKNYVHIKIRKFYIIDPQIQTN